MIVETGHYALVLALALALVNSIVPVWGSIGGDRRLMAVAPPAALMGFGLVAYAYFALTMAHVVSDFSLVNVVENSHSAKPLIYKITGVWGNHEGSMLLWVLVLSLFAAAAALFSRSLPEDLRANVLAVQSWIAAAFLLFILLTSNPFARLAVAPVEGNDLNPLLQDPGLAIHPPLLYLGYVGLSITYSFAAAALISGRIDTVFARFVRPWTLIAWISLTLGIAMGSYWAYYTLGWGGFWFWDPVENASLMPWLAATALLHCTAVMEKREALKIWTIFLAILAFSLSLLGTFLVRSGVLTSVHAFASDPTRGVFILLILVIFIGGSFALFGLRASELKQGGLFAPVSREGALVLNNLLLTTCCATVFTGTLYPLALEAVTGEKISVGAPFFNLTFVPLFIPLFILMPIGQLLPWKRGDLAGVAQRLAVAFGVALIFMAVLAAWRGGPAISVILSGVALYVIVGSFVDLGRRLFGGSLSAGVIGQRARGLPRHTFGTAFAHAGLGVTLLGLAATGWGVEKITALKPGERVEIGPYELIFESVVPRQGPNYSEQVGRTVIRAKGAVIATIEPATRFYPARSMNRSEAGIATLGLGQVYMSIADVATNGVVNARIFWKPLVALIWIGALVMAFGGCLSLSDRSFRVGIARRPCHKRRHQQQKDHGQNARKNRLTVIPPIAGSVFAPCGWPDGEIDHIDLDKSNDRWANLRLATPSQNGANRIAQKNNTSGAKGVTRTGKKFVAKKGSWIHRSIHSGKPCSAIPRRARGDHDDWNLRARRRAAQSFHHRHCEGAIVPLVPFKRKLVPAGGEHDDTVLRRL